MALQDPTRASKLARLDRARARFGPLLEDSRLWENECEGVFAEFRVAVVHLRRDGDGLDAIEDKPLVWRFLSKLSRERRPFWGRCEEVLRTLMQSDQWMKAFADDPEMNLNDLPTNVIKEFGARVEEVGGLPQVHVRLAIIGCGATAARHCASVSRWNEQARGDFYRVVALCDPVPSRIAALRELPDAAKLKLNECEEVSTIEALFDKVDFDAAAFFSHNHREGILTELFARKKCVIVEPPLAPTLEAAARLVKLSRQQPATQMLLVAERGEYWPEGGLTRDVGEVITARAGAAASGQEASELLDEGIGCVLSPGLLCVRALRRLAGPVERVCGRRRALAVMPPTPPDASAAAPASSSRSRRSAPSSETFAACLLQHAGGAVSSLHLQSCCGPPPSPALQLAVGGTLGHAATAESNLSAGDGPLGCGEGALRPDGGERLWELFSHLLAPIARNAAEPPSVPEGAAAETQRNVDEHLADLAVVQAVQRSFQTERFEVVDGPRAEP